MRIIVDVMGGDFAPQAPLDGALLALDKDKDLELILAGDQPQIEEYLKEKTYDVSRIEILHAPDAIGYDEAPVAAIRKQKESSLVKGFQMLKNGQADGIVSAGNTGAILAGATLIVRRMDGVKRPALASLLPTLEGKPVLLLDCGANADCKASYLRQFAVMGNAYMKSVCGVESPKVALLNNGTEEGKGNEVTKAAYDFLKDLDLNFVGNYEARELLSGDADVFVCDGFVGNAVLKTAEGATKTLLHMLKAELKASFISTLGAAIAKPAFRRVKKRMDYSEYGGAPLLGIRKCVIKAHGTSNAKSIFTAILQAGEFIRSKTGDIIAQQIGALPDAED